MKYKTLFNDLQKEVEKVNKIAKNDNIIVYHTYYDYKKYYKLSVRIKNEVVFDEEIYEFDLENQVSYDTIKYRLFETLKKSYEFAEEYIKIFNTFKNNLNLSFEDIKIVNHEIGKYKYNNVSLFSSYIKLLDDKNCPRWILCFIDKKTNKIDFIKTRTEHDKNISKYRKDLQSEPPNVRYIIDFEQAKNYLSKIEDQLVKSISALPENNKFIKESSDISLVFFTKFYPKNEINHKLYEKYGIQSWQINGVNNSVDGIYIAINSNEIDNKNNYIVFEFKNNSSYENKYFAQSVDTKEIFPIKHLTNINTIFEPAFLAVKNINSNTRRYVLSNLPKKKAFKEQIIKDKIEKFFDENVIGK